MEPADHKTYILCHERLISQMNSNTSLPISISTYFYLSSSLTDTLIFKICKSFSNEFYYICVTGYRYVSRLIT
jgi:hypothetical protein